MAKAAPKAAKKKAAATKKKAATGGKKKTSRKKKAAPASLGLDAAEVGAGDPPAEVAALADQVESDGGAVLARYRDPFGGHWLILCSLPLAKVSPTPFQRELSATHAKRLEAVIPKVGRFLDPLVAIRAPDGSGYWTPNGMHRLEAMKNLGAKAVVTLLVPDVEVAYRILALNTEKAHNLKDKSLEVVRMARDLASDELTGSQPESTWEFEFEEPAYLTFGHCYDQRARFSGGAYQPVVKRVESFLDAPIRDAVEVRKGRAEKLMALDDAVNDCVKKLKDAGLTSAYLKPFVVARINPLRFSKARRTSSSGPLADFDETIDKMIGKAESFDASKVKPQDLAGAGYSGSDD